ADPVSLARCLPARRERPRRRAAEQRDELAALHSITSSARARSVGGTSRPNDLAALRLMINSNRVACSMGRSAGFAPLRILSTKTAPRRQMWGKFTPYAARPPASQYSLNPTPGSRFLIAVLQCVWSSRLVVLRR